MAWITLPPAPSTGGGGASLVQPTRLFVSPALALTTPATLCPRSTSRFTREATWRMRSRSASEVPPNFMAMVAIFAPNFAAAYINGAAPSLNPGAQPSKMTVPSLSIDPVEVAKFSALAAEWWDPEGKFAPLHKFNPVRLDFIRREAAAHFNRGGRSVKPFGGVSLV